MEHSINKKVEYNMELENQRIIELEKHVAQLYEGLQGAIDLSTLLLIQLGKMSPELLAEYIELLISLKNELVEKDSMRETVIHQLLSSLLGEEGVPLAKRRGLKLLNEDESK